MSSQDNRSECEEHGRAAAYVLSALENGEAVRFGEHLDSCSSCKAEVAALQPVADSLPAAVPRVVASEELRERIMATVRSEAELLHEIGRAHV